MEKNIYIYMLIMISVTYVVRALPLTLIKKQITNRFIKSFLYYVPYVTLAVMTFPAITECTESFIPGLSALIVGGIAAWFNLGLFPVAIICCVVVFLVDLFV